MSRGDLATYTSRPVRLVPFPTAEASGAGWWRVAWKVETEPAVFPGEVRLPPPSCEVGDLTLIVAVWPREPGRLTVEVLSRYEKLTGEEIAYVSRIMQALRALYQEVRIDGHRDHPLLRMARG